MSSPPSLPYLLSPLEPKLLNNFDESYSQSSRRNALRGYHVEPGVIQQNPKVKAVAPLSPPVSPYNGQIKKLDIRSPLQEIQSGAKPSVCMPDPILFPDGSSSVSNVPLFKGPVSSLEELVAKHIARQLVPSKTGDPRHSQTHMPSKQDYMLAIHCVPGVCQVYNENPALYLKRELDAARRDYPRVKRLKLRSQQHLSPTVPTALHQALSISSGRRTKDGAIQRPGTTSTKRLAVSHAYAVIHKPPTTSRMGTPQSARSDTPDAKGVHKRVEDIDFDILVDYSPNLSEVLGEKAILRAEWPGNAVNLSHDPCRHLLDEAEVPLASTLRLSCATYLCSKRRIFAGRLNAYRAKREFRKTDAQQACKIDVNKASKLWMAYDKAGLFRREYFEQWL